MGDELQKSQAQPPNRSFKFFLQLAAVFLVAPVLLWFVFGCYRPFEPHYNGKSLSQWADDAMATDEAGSQNSPGIKLRNLNGESAIRQMGTNALPLALAYCAARDSDFKRKIAGWSDDLSGRWHLDVHIPSEMEKYGKGIAILTILGSEAKPAIPGLVAILQGRDSYVYSTAMQGLAAIGPDSIPPLMEMFTNGHKWGRSITVEIFGFGFGRQASNAAPVLFSFLEDKDPALRGTAAESLARISREPAKVVPILLKRLAAETNQATLFHVITALGILGTNAWPATPILIKLAESHNAAAMSSLRRIDQNAAEKVFEQWRAEQTN